MPTATPLSPCAQTDFASGPEAAYADLQQARRFTCKLMAALEEEVDACLEYPEGEEEAFAAKAFLWGKDSAVSALSKLAPLLMKLVITEADLANGKSDGGEYDREAGDLEEEIDWGIIERYRARQQANDE